MPTFEFLATCFCLFAASAALQISTKAQEGGLQSKHDDSTPMELLRFSASQATPKLVWFVGDSNSYYAVRDTCANAKAKLVGEKAITNWSSPFHWTGAQIHCTLGGLTLFNTFHPGASDPPHYTWDTDRKPWQNYTVQGIATSKVKKLRKTFGKNPDVIIVNSDVWDVHAWWQYSGRPASWPVPHSYVKTWCHSTIPQLLDFLQQLVPTARVVFRSPQPSINNNNLPVLKTINETMDEMAACIRKSAYNATHLFADTGPKYRLLDWTELVGRKLQTWGGDVSKWYYDSYHPGPELRRVTMNALLDWLRRI